MSDGHFQVLEISPSQGQTHPHDLLVGRKQSAQIT